MTSFTLKMVALGSMMIDHVGYTFSSVWNTYFMRLVGRVAFPVYAFLIAEGCRNTSDIRKYLIRLGIFALLSEIPFDLFMVGRVFAPGYQNVFFTLFFGVMAIWAYETALSKKWNHGISVFICIPFAAFAYLMKTDYGAYGVVAIFSCYLSKTRWQQAASLTLVMFATYVGNISMFAATLPAVLLISMYDGRRGIPIKFAFYVAYPIHLLILAGISYMIL